MQKVTSYFILLRMIDRGFFVGKKIKFSCKAKVKNLLNLEKAISDNFRNKNAEYS